MYVKSTFVPQRNNKIEKKN